jgi:methylenetetrahydrofolate--tRNA-(uracil-5-)-methyltransferase
MVGFQTKLRHGEQTRIFRMIPGLEGAEFARLGGLHRNTYLNSPRLLDAELRLKAMRRLRFAGQITGCEGYVESAAIGLLAGRFAAGSKLGRSFAPPPATTAMGALLTHITGGHILADAEGEGDEAAAAPELVGTAAPAPPAGPRSFQPMNVNFGLFPPMAAPLRGEGGERLRGPAKGLARRRAMSERALRDLEAWRSAVGG